MRVVPSRTLLMLYRTITFTVNAYDPVTGAEAVSIYDTPTWLNFFEGKKLFSLQGVDALVRFVN